MLKLLGSILIIGASAALGLAVRQKVVIRLHALTEWIDCVNLLMLEIGDRGTPLHDACLVLSRSRNGLIAPFFRKLAEQIGGLPEFDFRKIWRNGIKNNMAEWEFGTSEQEVLNGIADYLGQYDGEAQVKSLRNAMVRLQAMRNEAAEELRSKSSLYRTCGTALGILLVLILV